MIAFEKIGKFQASRRFPSPPCASKRVHADSERSEELSLVFCLQAPSVALDGASPFQELLAERGLVSETKSPPRCPQDARFNFGQLA
jgi:hypothetical protein